MILFNLIEAIFEFTMLQLVLDIFFTLIAEVANFATRLGAPHLLIGYRFNRTDSFCHRWTRCAFTFSIRMLFSGSARTIMNHLIPKIQVKMVVFGLWALFFTFWFTSGVIFFCRHWRHFVSWGHLFCNSVSSFA